MRVSFFSNLFLSLLLLFPICVAKNKFLQQIHFAPPLNSLVLQQTFSSKQLERDFLNSNHQLLSPPYFSGPSDPDYYISLTNGVADIQLSYVFIPDQNYTIEDYVLQPNIGNPDIFTEEDLSIEYVEDTSNGFLAYNVTVDIDLNKWTGISAFSLSALNLTTQEVVSTSTTADLVVLGITFYYTNSTGNNVLVGGANYPLKLATEDIQINSNFNLNVFIQFLDRTTSDTATSRPLSDVSISTESLSGQVSFSSECEALSGQWDGNDVDLPEGCGLGFTDFDLAGDYIGPYFGFDFNPYVNGTFTVLYEWNELLFGSDIEFDGYGTFITVNLEGEVPPLVKQISPNGPFTSSGGDQVTLYVENLPQTPVALQSWTYFLEILFSAGTAPATYIEGSAIAFSNGTAGLTFSLPSGEGTNVSWNLTVTKETGELLSAADLTNPTYLFNFTDVLEIFSIEPNSGPEEGGTTVSLIGDFPGAEGGEINVMIDGVLIDSSLILNASKSNVTFITPPKQDIGENFEVSIVVSIDGLASNGLTFTYLPTILLESMTPTTGPVGGGTQVTLTGVFPEFDPTVSNTGIYFSGVRINPSLIASYNTTHIIFNTPSQVDIGSSSVYTYQISVQVNGISSNSISFVYESPIQIISITPSSGDVLGGTEVTLQGTFSAYDPATSVLYFGGQIIPSAEIEFNETTLVFITPPLSEVGSAYTQNVYVVIGILESNKVQYTYQDIGSTIGIVGGGGSYDSSGNYLVGICSDSLYRASISSGVRFQNPVYTWSLTFQESPVDILSSNGVVTTGEVLYIPYSSFPEQDVPYTLTLSIQTSYATFSQSLTIIQLSFQRIGVFINDPSTRSIANPNVTLTIPAELFVPGCSESALVINSTAMTYVWLFREQAYVFSYENQTAPELEVSPTLLGREFHIPQNLMEYGSFSLSLTAYLTENTTIRGSDSTTVRISPAKLIPRINGGEYSQLISETEDLTVSAARSRDPDVLDSDGTSGLSYSWSCRYAWDETMQDALVCGDSLLPPSSRTDVEFTVSRSSLESVQNTTTVHIEYSLQVSKISLNATGDELLRRSEIVTSTFILGEETLQEYQALQDVTVMNNQSISVELSSVKYYEDITITPVSETEETTWTYQVLSPLSQSRTLLASDDNLLVLPGYYTAGSEASRLSLGFKANVLTPSTEYRILISTQHPEFAINEHIISITTIEQPRVEIGSLATPSGNIEDIFALSAYTSYDGDFKFFFILTDQFGYETCVGGCQGENVVKFRLASAGSYAVRCDVYDWIGFTLLATTTASNITVIDNTSTEDDLTVFHAEAYDAFLAGDHATYQQLGSDMVKFIWSNGGSTAQAIDSDLLTNFTAGMNQIAANAVPNSIQSAGYVSMATALASLTPELGITYDTQTLYYLLNITMNAIDRVPDNGALQVVEELLQFYDLTPSLVLASLSEGTTRRRLVAHARDTESEILDIWLDLYTVMKLQISVSLLKRCNCGCMEEVSTGMWSASSHPFSPLLATTQRTSAAAGYINPFQGQISRVNVAVGHFCNSEQGSSLTVNSGNDGETEFTWCKEVFGGDVRKLYFGLATTPDYIYLSKLHRNTTLTNGLAATMVASLDGNSLVDLDSTIDKCYTLRMPIPRNVTEYDSDVPSDEVPLGLRFAPEKPWNVSASNALYIPSFTGLTVTFSDSATTADSELTTASIVAGNTGVYTVGTRAAWGGAIFSFEGMLLLAAEIIGVTLTILILVLVATVVTWGIATRLIAAGAVVAPVEADFTYVERDVYGRGTALEMMDAQDAAAQEERRKVSAAMGDGEEE